MSNGSIILPVIVLALGLAFLVIEMVVPSHGVLTILAGLCMMVATWIAFTIGTNTGLVFLLITFGLLLGAPALAFQIWPHTPWGKHIFLSEPAPDEIRPHDTAELRLQQLVGQVGRTITPLRPSGATEFDGRRVDTIAEGVMIDRDELVRVIAVRGTRVVVRRISDDPLPPTAGSPPALAQDRQPPAPQWPNFDADFEGVNEL